MQTLENTISRIEEKIDLSTDPDLREKSIELKQAKEEGATSIEFHFALQVQTYIFFLLNTMQRVMMQSIIIHFYMMVTNDQHGQHTIPLCSKFS